MCIIGPNINDQRSLTVCKTQLWFSKFSKQYVLIIHSCLNLYLVGFKYIIHKLIATVFYFWYLNNINDPFLGNERNEY